MASSYNQRSGSSGSKAPKKSSTSQNSNNKAGLNRTKAGYYAKGSKKSTQNESFENRAARKRLASLPHTNDPLQMSSSNRNFTAKKTGQSRPAPKKPSRPSTSTAKAKTSSSRLSSPAQQNKKNNYKVPPTKSSRTTRAADTRHTGYATSRQGTKQATKQTTNSSRLAGRTIGDIKASQTVPSFFDVNRHIIIRLGLICGIIVAILLLLVILSRLPILKIENVTVSNNSYLSSQTVLDLAAVPDSATLLNPDAQGIQQRVASNPWVESAQVHRVFPAGIDIVVNESPIQAKVDVPVTVTIPTPTVWALSPSGVWLDQIVGIPQPSTVTHPDGSQTTTTVNPDASTTAVTNNVDGSVTTVTTAADGAVTTQVAAVDGSSSTTSPDGTVTNIAADGSTTTIKPDEAAAQAAAQAQNTTAALTVNEEQIRIALAAEERPTIIDVASSVNPVAGEACTDAGLLNALAILTGSSQDFSSQIAQISAPSVEKTVLLLTNGVTVAFGSASDIASKERVINQLLSEHEGNISYINVRVVDRPAWRGLV